MMDYKKIAYEALQRVSVSTIWSDDALDRVAIYLEGVLKDKIKSDNSDYAKCGCGNTDGDFYCEKCLAKIAEQGN